MGNPHLFPRIIVLMGWADALATWRAEGGGGGIPRRGTPQYDAVVAIMRRDDPGWNPPAPKARASASKAARAARSIERLCALGITVPQAAIDAAKIRVQAKEECQYQARPRARRAAPRAAAPRAAPRAAAPAEEEKKELAGPPQAAIGDLLADLFEVTSQPEIQTLIAERDLPAEQKTPLSAEAAAELESVLSGLFDATATPAARALMAPAPAPRGAARKRQPSQRALADIAAVEEALAPFPQMAHAEIVEGKLATPEQEAAFAARMRAIETEAPPAFRRGARRRAPAAAPPVAAPAAAAPPAAQAAPAELLAGLAALQGRTADEQTYINYLLTVRARKPTKTGRRIIKPPPASISEARTREIEEGLGFQLGRPVVRKVRQRRA
jgi:hypothetical protein